MNRTKRRILVTGGSGFIGTNYIDFLSSLGDGIEILNLDIAAPPIEAHNRYWQECDLCDADKLTRIFERYQPTEIVHLAARTDTDSSDLNDYSSNIVGTTNLLSAIKSRASVQRFILTSSQFVKKPGLAPVSDIDFDPHTAYGESKVINEKDTRNAQLECSWTIIRPTNIWGPWHPRYPQQFWRVVAQGMYFHPGGNSAIRSYGYVENVVFQIESILAATPHTVNQQVFYVGDAAIKLIDWVNGFSVALTAKPVRVLPRVFVRFIALVGDLLVWLGLKFPITSSRFRSMTTDDVVPMQKTIETFGVPPVTLTEGIKNTVIWLKAERFVKEIFLND